MPRHLIEAGLDRISIYADGTCAEEYETVRIGAKFDTLVNNLKTLFRLKREYQDRGDSQNEKNFNFNKFVW